MQAIKKYLQTKKYTPLVSGRENNKNHQNVIKILRDVIQGTIIEMCGCNEIKNKNTW